MDKWCLITGNWDFVARKGRVFGATGIRIIKRYQVLLKTELRISDFQHFHWLAGHRLSVHIPAVPNMVKERVSNKVN